MGQYHVPVNLTKREFVWPHKVGSGLKQWEQVHNEGVPQILFALLCSSNCRGGGDLDFHPIVGRWAGDAIAIVGDYSEPGDLPAEYNAAQIYSACADAAKGRDTGYTDISEECLEWFVREFSMTVRSLHGWREVVRSKERLQRELDYAASLLHMHGWEVVKQASEEHSQL